MMKLDNGKAWSLLAASLVATVGCTPKPESSEGSSGSEKSGPVVMSTLSVEESDDRIEEAFESTYVYRAYLKEDAVKIDSKDGHVTLTGTVAHESHKGLAEDTAGNLQDVKVVHNELITEAEDAAANADSWIARKITMALMFNRNVNADMTTVTVKDGVVSLSGSASSIAQKDLTTEYAKDIEGVVEVNNSMTIAALPATAKRTEGEKMDDASITAQIRSALYTHRSTSAVKTRVITRSGNVTLTGIAKNEAEKSLVTKLVNDIRGVASVDNQMTIEVAQK